MGRRAGRAALTVALAGALALAPAWGPSAGAASSKVTWTTAKVLRWVDGDTVRTSKGTVRIIGFDAPERGRCGAASATAYAKKLAPVGSSIRLGNPANVVDRDAYGRALRYVERTTASGRIDIALKQIVAGSAARYDGRDGYQWHPRQVRYRGADARHVDLRCGSSPSGGSWATRVNSPVTSTNPDLDCGDLPSTSKPIRITGTDYHRLDADGDGWGCDGG